MKYIIAGLGNPGEKYTFTKHNAGFLALDYISQKDKFKITDVKFHAFTKKIRIAGEEEPFDVLYMKPQTFMNLSGESISAAARFYKIPPENIIVIFDDASLPAGKMRIRKNGSDGGHNGLKSIIYHLASDKFPRVKIGVGEKPHPDYDLADWVLAKFGAEEQKVVFDTFTKAYDALHMMFLPDGIDKAMNKFNG